MVPYIEKISEGGHRPIALVGAATELQNPSAKAIALSPEQLQRMWMGLRDKCVLDFDGQHAALLNN